MIGIRAGRNAVPREHRINQDSLRLPKLVFSAFAITGFIISTALLLLSTAGLQAFAILGWSTLYLAVVFGLDERRRWGQILAIAILIVQPVVLANFTTPFWQLGAIAGVAAMPLIAYLSRKKVGRLLY